MAQKLTQRGLVMEFFQKNPCRDIKRPEVVDWLNEQWVKRTGEVFRDPDRQIRQLAQSGKLQKVSKGTYRYDPDLVIHRELEDFTQSQKEEILKRDNYRCVECGLGTKDGVDLHVDHIIPKDKGGKATIENGQTLCAPHNFKKKTYNQTQTGKRMIIRLYELSKTNGDTKTHDFCKALLEVYDKHGINGHIEWKK